MSAFIGITPSYDEEKSSHSLKKQYSTALLRAGGIPLSLCYTDTAAIPEILDRVQGILLSGGGDIDPLLFGEEPIFQSGLISPTRDSYELSLCRQALARDIPILAVCRGVQVLNVAIGGTIFQDILASTRGTLKHAQQAPSWYGTHTVSLEENTKLYKIIGKKQITVNSFHHQAIGRLGQNGIVSAKAADGIIEAIEVRDKAFALGVQWHPEDMAEREPVQQAIFQAFIEEIKRRDT